MYGFYEKGKEKKGKGEKKSTYMYCTCVSANAIVMLKRKMEKGRENAKNDDFLSQGVLLLFSFPAYNRSYLGKAYMLNTHTMAIILFSIMGLHPHKKISSTIAYERLIGGTGRALKTS